MNRKERRAAGDRKPAEPTVELAYIHPGDVSDAFMSSVIRLRDYEAVRTQRLIAVRSRRSRSGSIDKSRNEITTMFHRGKADYLWMVDADMGFAYTALQMMLSVADPTERPLVTGLCFAHRTEGFDEETNAEIFGMIPTLSVWDIDEAGTILGWKAVLQYPRNAVCKVDSSGAACVLIHRSVIDRMHAEFGNNWWTKIKHPTRENESFGEDTSFFMRAHELGIPLHAHTGVRTSHDKGGIFLTEQTWDEQNRLRGHHELLVSADETGDPVPSVD